MGTRDRKPRPKTAAYITPEGARRLKEELDRLWTDERPRVTQAVHEAALLGDRSENADYIYGKRRLREIDARLRWIAKRLDEIVVVEPTARTDGKVYFGATVTLEDDDGGEVQYRLVGPDETDAKAGQISVDSPIGKALLGRTDGDDVKVVTPGGTTTYTIVGVRYDGSAT